MIKKRYLGGGLTFFSVGPAAFHSDAINFTVSLGDMPL